MSSNQRRSRGHHHQSRNSRNHQLYREHMRLHPGQDDFSFISPCVKYSLFFFNLVFWVSLYTSSQRGQQQWPHFHSTLSNRETPSYSIGYWGLINISWCLVIP